MRSWLDDLPRTVAKEVREVLAKEPGLSLEAAVGETFRRRPELIRVWRSWERQGRPTQTEMEIRERRAILDRALSDAILVGAQIEELRRRVQVLYPKPAPPRRDPREAPQRPQERETWTAPVRKSDEDWRVSILENAIAELGALVDTLTPAQRNALNRALNLLGRLAEELGGERSRRRLEALAAA